LQLYSSQFSYLELTDAACRVGSEFELLPEVKTRPQVCRFTMTLD